ncbi:MAG: LysM peptidoglycan-binding domain-containing protein [Roseburia sp.]|nr:LysM peptidoglycan-binding domain-containing protein [Roseburia sp.]
MYKKLLKTAVAITALVGVLAAGTVSFAAEEYTVQSDDSLAKIADRFYGDATKWKAIYEANKASVKNPNLIYRGQVLIIPDLTPEEKDTVEANTATNETIPVPPSETEASTPATETEASTPAAETEDSASVADTTTALPAKNVPVGANPVYTDFTGGGYRYTFKSGKWIHCPAAMDSMSEITDAYGVTYREYYGVEGTNEAIMKSVADYIAQNPSSNFASLISQYGNQFVIVTTRGGLWDDSSDYTWFYGIMDCEPEDCVYMFIPGYSFEEGEVEAICNELFDAVSSDIYFN